MAKEWSMERLAEEVSKAEGLEKKLAWQTVQQWETKTAPKRKRLSTVANLLGIPMSDLMDMGETSQEIDLAANPEFPAIRRVRFKLSAGASGFAIEYRGDDGAPIVFQRSWYEGRGFTPSKLFAVKIANGSMEPRLCDGDTVVVNTESTTPKDGVVFAVNYEGEMVVKRLVRDEGRWWLYSDNPDQAKYPRKSCGEDVHLIGEIVHKQSETI